MTAWLVDTFLATSALALLVLLVREPVRRLFGSRVTYALWLIPAARMFMPTLRHTVERTVPATVPIQPFTDPLVRESLWMARVAPAQLSLLDRVGGLPTLLIAAWLAVAAALFLSRMIAFRRDRRAVLASSAEIGRAGRVRIVRSPEILSPVALGIFTPMIVVPREFERLYGAREQRLVLEHELAHHRSGDLVANLFAFVLLCLQWFNPLAWAAHAAFRFDQEAACDARVLDKASAGDRADYCRAIAKAASGRALLFASALDRPNTLKRRLQSMLRSSNPYLRLVGRLLVVGAVAAALPLTASRAVDYVDVPAAQATPPVAAVPAASPVSTPVAAAAVVQAAPAQALAPVRRAAPRDSDVQIDRNLSINGDTITIDGVTKRWEDLTPAEKAEVRAGVEKARTALANVHIDRAKIMRDIANVPSKADLDKIQRDLVRSQANVAQTMSRLRAQREALRRAGQDPDQIEATVAEAMKSVQAVDMDAVRRSVAAVDPQKIAQSLDGAEQSMRRARTELDRLQARMDADRQQ
jgi:beta-lactamase regulating signal transducer with metallopeptidase domain